MRNFALGLTLGIVLTYLYGWTPSASAAYSEFKRGVGVGRRHQSKGI